MVPGAASRPPYVHHIPYTLAHTTKNPTAAASHSPDVALEDQYLPVSPPVPVVRSLEKKTSGYPQLCSFTPYVSVLLLSYLYSNRPRNSRTFYYTSPCQQSFI